MCLTFFFFPPLSSCVQPAKEENVEEGTEKSPEEAKVTKEGEGAEEEQKKEEQQQQQKKEEEQKQEGAAEGEQEVGESQNIFQSPLRLVRKAKMKLVVCHVTLLDGTDFSCEVEVRQRDKSVVLKSRWTL